MSCRVSSTLNCYPPTPAELTPDAPAFFVGMNAAGCTFYFPISDTFSGLPVYLNNAAAVTGGLAVGDPYRTPTGEVRVRV